jgi:organic hydroperoxide reductase OsmC/OhrA
MKTMFTSEVVSKGARSGTLLSPDGLLDVTLGNPLENGIETRGPNPETLFAGAYSACYHGAVVNAAEKLSIAVTDSENSRGQANLYERDRQFLADPSGSGIEAPGAVRIHEGPLPSPRALPTTENIPAKSSTPISKSTIGQRVILNLPRPPPP